MALYSCHPPQEDSFDTLTQDRQILTNDLTKTDGILFHPVYKVL